MSEMLTSKSDQAVRRTRTWVHKIRILERVVVGRSLATGLSCRRRHASTSRGPSATGHLLLSSIQHIRIFTTRRILICVVQVCSLIQFLGAKGWPGPSCLLCWAACASCARSTSLPPTLTLVWTTILLLLPHQKPFFRPSCRPQHRVPLGCLASRRVCLLLVARLRPDFPPLAGA